MSLYNGDDLFNSRDSDDDFYDFNSNYQDLYQKYYMYNFGKPKFLAIRGKGSKLYDEKGNEYIDFLAGIAVNALGHANDDIAHAISMQAKRLVHSSNFFTTKEQLLLVKKLAKLVGEEHNPHTLLTNSGTESVECALKIVKKHAKTSGRVNSKIIAFNNSFHGRSLGALSVTSKEKYRDPFAPLIPNVQFIDAELKALQNAFTDRGGDGVCAVILECIQGEAGVKPLSTELIGLARKLCTENDALLIIDEVQTGIGRTGGWFAYQEHKIVPDIITLAKGLGGGFPIGAVIATGKTADILTPGDHGTTFGGNPLACKVALTVLETIGKNNLMGNALSAFESVKTIINNHKIPEIIDVRGSGLLIAIELNQPISAKVCDRALEMGLIVNNVNETSIRIAPALNITPAELYSGMNILCRAIKEVLGTD